MTPEEQKKQALDRLRKEQAIADLQEEQFREEYDPEFLALFGVEPQEEVAQEPEGPADVFDQPLPEVEQELDPDLQEILAFVPEKEVEAPSVIPDDIWEKLMEEEGREYTNYPSDKGGETKFGISKNANPDIDVKNLTEDQARRVATDRYWNKLPARHRNWDNLQRIYHGTYDPETADLSEIDRKEKDFDKWINNVYEKDYGREYINGWFNRTLGEDRFSKRKINLQNKTKEEVIRIKDELIQELKDKDASPFSKPVGDPERGILMAGGDRQQELEAVVGTESAELDPELLSILEGGEGLDPELEAILKEAAPAEAEPEVGFGEGALSQAVQGITFGTGENLGALSRTVGYWLGSGEDQEIDFTEKFKEYRKQIQDENRAFSKEHPKTAFAFDVGGGILTSTLLPGAGLLKAAKVQKMGKVGQAAVTGGAEGVLAGLGYSEDGEELEGMAFGAILGAGASAGISKVAQKLQAKGEAKRLASSLTEEIQEAVTDLAESNAQYNKVVYDTIGLDQNKILLGSAEEFGEEINKLQMPAKAPSLADVPLSKELAERTAGEATDVITPQVTETVAVSADETIRDAISQKGTQASLQEAQVAVKKEIIGYMRFVTDTRYRQGTAKELTQRQLSSTEYIEDLLGKFKEAERKNLVTPASYDLYKKQQYLAEAVSMRREAFVENALRSYLDEPDQELYDKIYNYGNLIAPEDQRVYPTKEFLAARSEAVDAATNEFNTLISKDIGTLKKKFYETNMMFRNIDRNAGTDLEVLQNDIYEATNIKNFWEQKHINNLQEYSKLGGPSDEEIYSIMDRLAKGELSEIPEEAAEKVAAIQKVTGELLEESRAAGIDIKSKGEFYVPKRRKYGSDYVKAMEAQYLQSQKLDTEAMDTLIDVVTSGDSDRLYRTFNSVSPELKEHLGFVMEMQRFLGDDLSKANIKSFFNAKTLHSRRTMQSLLEADAGALHSRKEIIPEFLIDKKITRSLIRNISETSRLIHLEPLAQQLDMNVSYLNSLGMDNAAQAVKNYRKDIMGQYRKGANHLDNAWIEKLALEYGDRVYEYKQMADFVTNAIYPNLIGTNPASTIRNLFQPLYKTIPEMGYFSPKGFINAYVDAFKQLSSKEGMEALQRKGIITTELVDAMSDLSSTSLTKVGGKTASGIRKINQFLMWSFTMSDHLNRVVTANLADQLIDDLVTVKSAKALKAVEYMPPAIQSKVNRLIRQSRFASFPKELVEETKRSLRNHYSVQTQLVYGKAGNSEFAREMPRMITMMSKWPIAIGTDIADIMSQRDRWTRFGQKYLVPSLLATSMAAVLRPEEGEEAEMAKLLFGSSYGGAYAPLNTMMELNLTSPVVGGLSSFAKNVGLYTEGMLMEDKQATRKGARGIGSGVSQFVPVVGAMYKAADRYSDVLDYEDPVNLLLPEEYEYEGGD